MSTSAQVSPPPIRAPPPRASHFRPSPQNCKSDLLCRCVVASDQEVALAMMLTRVTLQLAQRHAGKSPEWNLHEHVCSAETRGDEALRPSLAASVFFFFPHLNC